MERVLGLCFLHSFGLNVTFLKRPRASPNLTIPILHIVLYFVFFCSSPHVLTSYRNDLFIMSIVSGVSPRARSLVHVVHCCVSNAHHGAWRLIGAQWIFVEAVTHVR